MYSVRTLTQAAFMSSFVVMGCGFSNSAKADPQTEALDIIANFADRICSSVPVEGRSSGLELSGSAKAELSKVIKNIVDVGISGAAKYQNAEWTGVLQQDLAGAMKDERTCKLQVFNALKDRFIPANAPPDTRSDAERQSETSHSLPGDAIQHFRVTESTGNSLIVEVEYIFNVAHGDKVMAGASLKPTRSGYTPTFVPTTQKGKVRVPITLYDKNPSEELRVFLYEWGRPAEVFADRTYPFRRGWGD